MCRKLDRIKTVIANARLLAMSQTVGTISPFVGKYFRYGSKAASAAAQRTSASPRSADLAPPARPVRFVPTTVIARRLIDEAAN
jgi:3-methyladenine DNA glycosylase Tag